jgi:sulfate transport system ATP-binding protein
MSIEVKNLVKRFGNVTVCDHLNLHIGSGELVALLGPSGSGKTSLLRIIAGLEKPDSGSVYFEGRDSTRTDVRDRNVGFVFQHYALFPQMSIFENVAFGLRVRPKATRPSDAQIRAKVMELLKLVQLDWVADRFPHQLSGGQRQRIALARALAVEPQVLLLDEPFGALDAKVRKELRRWLRRLHDEMHVTSVFVTHDQEEAMEVADRIVVMNNGRIEQDGAPADVYDHPASPFVLEFLGDVNLFHARLDHTPGAPVSPTDVTYVRPHELQVLEAAAPDSIAVNLAHVLTVGPNVRLECRRLDDGNYIDVELPRTEFQRLREAGRLHPGLTVHLKASRVRRFVAEQAVATVLDDPAAAI